MVTEIPDLWDSSITVNVRTPAMILNYQREKLKQKTGGILEGELTKIESNGVTTLVFDLLAPGAQNVRVGILQVKFGTKEVYPAVVASAGLEQKPTLLSITNERTLLFPPELKFDDVLPQFQTIAYTQEEFIKVIGTVLTSDIIRAKMQSLIAICNEEQTQSVE